MGNSQEIPYSIFSSLPSLSLLVHPLSFWRYLFDFRQRPCCSLKQRRVLRIVVEHMSLMRLVLFSQISSEILKSGNRENKSTNKIFRDYRVHLSRNGCVFLSIQQLAVKNIFKMAGTDLKSWSEAPTQSLLTGDPYFSSNLKILTWRKVLYHDINSSYLLGFRPRRKTISERVQNYYNFVRVFDITNHLLTCHSLYFAPLFRVDKSYSNVDSEKKSTRFLKRDQFI